MIDCDLFQELIVASVHDFVLTTSAVVDAGSNDNHQIVVDARSTSEISN